MSNEKSGEEAPVLRLFDPFFFLSQPGLPARAFDDPWKFFLASALEYPDCDPHPLFETRTYLGSHPDLAAGGGNPLVHYLKTGAGKTGSRPNRLFNQRWYLHTQTHCPSSVLSPLEHFEAFSACGDASPNPNRLIETAYFNHHNYDLVVREQNPVSYLLRFSHGEPRLISSRIASIGNKILGFQDGPRIDDYRPIRCLIFDFGEGGELAALLRYLSGPDDAGKIEFVALARGESSARLPRELKAKVLRLEEVLGDCDPLECPAEIASFVRGLATPYKDTLVFSSDPGATPTLDHFPVHPLRDAGDVIRKALGGQTARKSSIEPAGDPKVIIPIVDWQISGVNTWAGELSSNLAARGWDVELLASRTYYRPNMLETQPPLPVKHLDLSSSKPEWWWNAARDYLNSQAPAVVLTAYDFNFNSLAGVAGDGIAMIGVVHSDDPVYYEQLRRLGRSWDHIIAVSDHIRGVIGERFPDLLHKTTTIHYGVPRWDGGRPGKPAPDEPLRLIYTGRIAHLQKRLLDLPRLFDALDERGVPFHLTLVGDGPDRAALESELAPRIARGEVEFTGRLPHGEIHAQLAGSHVFLLISDFEGLPLSLLEAMSHGTVPVVSDIDSGIPEVVHEGETGFRAPVGDYRAYAGILHRLRSDPELWEKVSRQTREYFEKELTDKVMVDRTEALIRRLWSKYPPRPHKEAMGPIGEPDPAVQRRGDIWLPPTPPPKPEERIKA